MTRPALEGLLFDGRTAAAAPVRVLIEEGSLLVTAPDGAVLHRRPLSGLQVSEPFASAPRQVTLPGGAVVEVADGAGLTTALAAAGRPATLVERLQQRWPAAAVSLLAAVALLWAGYVHGLPAAVRLIARSLPGDVERRLGEGALELLDGRLLRPSALPEAEQREAEERLAAAARLGAPGLRFQLVFRSAARGPGVNAFALPGGTIVLLDELVRRTGGDDRLVAVVGHELAHVSRHHATEALLRAAGVGAAASMLWGDFSGQAASVPAVLAMLAGSRAAEREADEEAVRFLAAAGRTARPMIEALCLLAAASAEQGDPRLPDLLSTHPDVGERLARLGAPEAACGAAAP
ncbi:MAG: M48 family metallopeptidase [Deltaproteobacteria bacterium]|nr:M48 family metallopeptidase [Deltaproteobacteria bacterium]